MCDELCATCVTGAIWCCLDLFSGICNDFWTDMCAWSGYVHAQPPREKKQMAESRKGSCRTLHPHLSLPWSKELRQQDRIPDTYKHGTPGPGTFAISYQFVGTALSFILHQPPGVGRVSWAIRGRPLGTAAES
ncbi:hypothetical protein GY45DRAFT_1080646 [Cubamyces sp. BRFM 1775]|nr:hypothetical protein GY45DRAFT_1080646 [Cubamyces sp. BRFM 1775]